jgi:uncharacterized protein (DUF2147 family)
MKHRSLRKKRSFLIASVALVAAVIAGFAVFPLAENADYSQIVGQWVRASGGYVLDIRSVQPDGALDAAYLNPRPINVSKAQANVSAGTIDLLVELRDTHYPGSYYTLVYDPPSDSLVGIYHHLGIGQNMSVTFSRKHNSAQAAGKEVNKSALRSAN